MKTEKYRPFIEEWFDANRYIEEVNRKTEEAKDVELLDRLIANDGNLCLKAYHERGEMGLSVGASIP